MTTKHSRWSNLAISLVTGLGFITLTDASQETGTSPTTSSALTNGPAAEIDSSHQARPDLYGRVVAKAGGTFPKATVFISTAGPKTGTSTFCPSCYADCRKSAKTDDQGNFKIESLDPQLTFRILVVANGCKPKFVAKVDPATGPIAVELDPIESGEVTPDRSVRGKVIDLEGKPIYGAVVEAHGISKKNDSGTRWGALPGVDPLAVTDEQGEFLLTAREPFESLELRVEARAFANKTFSKVTYGAGLHKLVLTEGAAVTGRVMWNGKPLAGVSVGMVSADRGVENFTGNFDVGTDKRGRFMFVNLPPKVDYFLYGIMSTLKPYGAIPSQKIHAADDGGTTEAGDLVVGSAQRLAGQVVLADGQPVPAKTRLLVSREGAWDSMQVVLDQEGRFGTVGIPQGTLTLSARVAGYRVSSRNGSFDRMNPFQLIGRLEHDITNLVFLLEKGADLRPEYGANFPESSWPQNRPLRGAEGTSEHSDQWILSGQVRDHQTKAALGEFRITPGNLGSSFHRSFWDQRSTTEGTNGSFVVYLDKKFGQPVLKVEADGYLPGRFTVLPESRSNLDFTLEQGAGPSGTILLPDGKPASGVSLALLCAGEQEVRLTADGHLRSFRDKDLIHITDPDGSFSFRPELDMEKVMVAAKEGFKLASLQEFAGNSKIVLEPWGRIKGVLHRASAPSTNETLDLAFHGDSHYTLEIHTETDAQGRFEFDPVPPGQLQINARNMMGHGGWTSQQLEKVSLKPGQSLEVNIQAPALSASLTDDFPTAPTPKTVKPSRNSGPGPEGIVLLPNGKPAADAEVALLVTGKFLSLGRGSLRAYEARQEGLVVHTDSNGHFSLPSLEGATGVVVVNEKGYAQVPLELLKRSPQITLQAWGRIEGILHVGRRLGTNELVILEQGLFGKGEPIFDANDFQARTDDQGRFIITFVPPGERKIARMIPQGEGSWMHSPATLVNVKPGEAVQVSIGGLGRTVFGKVRLSEAKPGLDWRHSQALLHTPFPKSFPMSGNQKEHEAWIQSPEGKAFAKSNHSYPVTIAADGSFRIEEVAPGNYEFHAVPTTSERSRSPSDLLGIFRKEVVVPEARNNDDDSPVDLGTLEGRLDPMPTAAASSR